MMKKTAMVLWAVLSVSLISDAALALPAFLDRRSEEKQRQSILERSSEILSKLYESQPQAKEAIETSYGYATFSNFGTKIIFVGGGTGRGLAVNNKTQQKTFMNMAELQAGLGLGIKKFTMVWVFETKSTFNKFVNSGWEIGGQTSAAAKLNDKGGSLQGATQIASGIWVYQLTDAGLALELTAKGTKYYRDHDLNAAK